MGAFSVRRTSVRRCGIRHCRLSLALSQFLSALAILVAEFGVGFRNVVVDFKRVWAWTVCNVFLDPDALA